jgi:hypothetical protein
MATGPEHYRRAERLVQDGVGVVSAIHATQDEDRRDALGKQAMGIWAQAQVHATLALAAATAMHPGGFDRWYDVAGEPAE